MLRDEIASEVWFQLEFYGIENFDYSINTEYLQGLRELLQIHTALRLYALMHASVS